MPTPKKMTWPQIIALVLLLLPPAAIFLLGIVGAIGGYFVGGIVLNLTWILSLFVLPLLTGLCVVLIVRAEKHVLDKVFFIFFLCVTVFFFYFGIMLFGTTQWLFPYETREEALRKEVTEFELMPSSEELGQPKKVKCYEYAISAVLYSPITDIMICEYDKEAYAQQKEKLQETYVFQTGEMVAMDHYCKPTATIDGYTFRTLSVEGEYEGIIDYPHYLFFIGTNDKTCEIVYMSYEDFDLDYIESLEDFINKDCGWKYIR